MGNKPEKEKSASSSDENLEDIVYDAMRLKGWVVPQTVEDVLRAEAEGAGKHYGSSAAQMPNPYEVLRRSSKESVKLPSMKQSDNGETEQQLARAARAARADRQIPPEIEERMKKDREKAKRQERKPNGD